ncbi:hypothetical protein PAHAL_4G356600 [Panicum hallii]|uniref:Uncharacterized protein n=1 Tax=Panicum hallii TaxID=206008 RepID=A0A2S3HMI3_9POAL|nr:hypothetical protein PAHAL_4G356600 [Panicum hallii]
MRSRSSRHTPLPRPGRPLAGRAAVRGPAQGRPRRAHASLPVPSPGRADVRRPGSRPPASAPRTVDLTATAPEGAARRGLSRCSCSCARLAVPPLTGARPGRKPPSGSAAPSQHRSRSHPPS